MEELSKYVLNDYWMLTSQISLLHRQLPLLTSGFDFPKNLQTCDIQLLTGQLHLNEYNITSISITTYQKLILLTFHFWKGNITSRLRAWSLGYWLESHLPYLMAQWPWGKVSNSSLLVWGNIRFLGFDKIMDTKHFTHIAHSQ